MKRRLIALLAAVLVVVVAGCSSEPRIEPGGVGPVEPGKVRVTYFGHAMFLVEDSANSVLVDPYGPDIGYILPKVKAKIVLVTDGDSDHSNVRLVGGDPTVVEGLGERWVGNFRVTGVPGEAAKTRKPKQRRNTIYYWEMAGLRFAHMGDFSQRALTDQQRVLLRGVDVLMMPVGGRSTVDAERAAKLTNAIQPRVVIPMHYKTRAVVLDLARVEAFTSRFSHIRRLEGSLLLTKGELPSETEVWTMKYQTQ